MESTAKSWRILLVDDEESIRRILTEFITSLGYEVDCFSTASEAWEAAQKITYAIALIDWTLPDISGIELLKRLRSLPDYASSILLVVTGRSDPNDLEEALRSGADDYLIKPVSIKLLGVRIQVAENQLLQKCRRQEAETAVHMYQSDLENRVKMRTLELEHANRALELQIQHRREAEAAVRESQERLRLALEATSDGLWDWDIQTDTAYGSPRWYEMLGYKADAFPINRDSWIELLHPEDRTAANNALEEHLEGRSDHLEVEYRACTAEGEWKWILNRGRIVTRNAQGSPLRMVGTHADVTERVHSRRQLESALRLESLASLAAGIAHEINQPLSALQLTIGMLEMSIEQERPFSSEELLSKYQWIRERATQISEIIQHMRALARQEHGSTTISTNINETVNRALSLLRVRMATHGIEIVRNLDKGLPEGQANPLQLEQVLVNILVNALQALDNPACKERTIAIQTQHKEDHLFLIIADTGPGFGESQDKIFNPFFTTKGSGSGMGLGLSLAHSFVTSWGGSITAQEREEGGAAFTLTLKTAEEE
ncbi:MAG: PAS domain-containing protein [Planctomycetota bacterium]